MTIALFTLNVVSLAGMAFGQTVLARAVQAAGFEWNSEKAHSAVYDTERTADLFCTITNRWNEFNPYQPDTITPMKITEGI